MQDVGRQLMTLAIHQDAAGIYNVGSGVPHSVLEMAEEIILGHGSTIRLKRWAYPDRSDEPLAFWAHMDKFHALQSILQTHP